MTTLAVMKQRIADEFRRDDLTEDIANAISTAIDAYKYERFHFNASAFVDAPASDGDTDNAWMTTAERLIRSRAKLEIVVNVLRDADDRLKNDLLQEVEDALIVLRRSRSHPSTATAGTLGAMKLRIANEINRSDLADEIANAITDAIGCYDDKRFFFNETRSFTFNTVQGQSRYTSDDVADLAKVLKIDFVILTLNGNTFKCWPRDPEFFEHTITTASNWPGNYGWYDETLVLYPTPADAYAMRIGCVEKMAAPADDSTTGNRWMTDAERLIRNRAKAALYTDVDDIADDKKAARFMALADEALEQLDKRTTRLTKTGPSIIRPFC